LNTDGYIITVKKQNGSYKLRKTLAMEATSGSVYKIPNYSGTMLVWRSVITEQFYYVKKLPGSQGFLRLPPDHEF